MSYGKTLDESKRLLDKYCNTAPSKIIKTIPRLFQYDLYENSFYLCKDKYCSTNGELSISVVEVDSKTFNPHWFIKERQNCPYILGLFHEDSHFAELFEEKRFYMN